MQKFNGKYAAWYALAILFAINALNFFDRLVIGAVGEPIRREFGLDDASLGALSTAFTLLYAIVGVPFGRLADTSSRKSILSIGVFLWSILTSLSGLAQNFWQIFILRLGVGVGEASCSPAATSLIGDMFPAERRATAMSIFMLGLPVGIGLSFAVSGTIAQAYGWRAAFFVAGLPGVLVAAAAYFIQEPDRRANNASMRTSPARIGSPYRSILASPTILWLIVSGILHNFCLYALSSFMTPYMMRFHGLSIRDASLNAMLINGVFTLPGLLFGGFFGDFFRNKRPGYGLAFAGFAILISAPLFLLAVFADVGSTILFTFSMGFAFALMYFYYSNVYAAIQDVTEPGVRGTAMSIYFMAMYLLGGGLGPFAVGLISDHFTRNAATSAGVSDVSAASFEPFRGEGLHDALFIIPAICVVLSIVLFAAARALGRDHEKIVSPGS